jgi:hypothetical protein
VKGKTFADVDARLEDLETDGALMGTNDIPNGDFTNGTTGWTSAFGSVSSANNVLTATASGSGLENLAIVDSPQNVILGNKYYFRFSARVLNSLCLKIEAYITGSTAGTDIRMVQLPVPVMNQKYPLSFTSIPPANSTGKIRFYIKHVYSDAATASGKTMEIERPLMLNLTAIFGAGKEPTAAEMDRLLARFTNSWFDGVKPIQTIETLYQEKAEKYQESWIAPTLLNAWINVGGTDDAAGYMKDSLGFVHLKGIIYNGVITAGTALLTLPAGYRPSKKLPVMALTSGGVIRLDIKNTGEVSIVSATSNSWLTLNNLTFRAEV